MSTKVDVLEERMNNIIESNTKEHKEIMVQIASINEKLDNTFVTKTEFTPVRAIVFGMVGLILTTVFGLLLSHVIGGE